MSKNKKNDKSISSDQFEKTEQRIIHLKERLEPKTQENLKKNEILKIESKQDLHPIIEEHDATETTQINKEDITSHSDKNIDPTITKTYVEVDVDFVKTSSDLSITKTSSIIEDNIKSLIINDSEITQTLNKTTLPKEPSKKNKLPLKPKINNVQHNEKEEDLALKIGKELEKEINEFELNEKKLTAKENTDLSDYKLSFDSNSKDGTNPNQKISNLNGRQSDPSNSPTFSRRMFSGFIDSSLLLGSILLSIKENFVIKGQELLNSLLDLINFEVVPVNKSLELTVNSIIAFTIYLSFSLITIIIFKRNFGKVLNKTIILTKDFKKPSYIQVISRELLLRPFVILSIYGIYFLKKDKSQKLFHDKLPGTIVVIKND